MDKLIGLFPGQGSQAVGMGKEVFESNEIAKNFFEKADSALGFSISSLCFEGPIEELSKTEFAQPAILLCSVVAYEIWKNANPNTQIIIGAGHSLGEYSALVASGALTFEDAVVLVNKRGKYMQEATPEGIGAMIAVMGVEVDELQAACDEIEGVVELANINAPGQIVVSGEKDPVLSLKDKLPGKRIVELNVSAPFHCSLMKPAAEKLAIDLDEVEIKEGAFPVIANVSAKPLSNPEDIRQALKDQVCGSVRWTDSMGYALKDEGVASGIEFGNGKVISGLMKRIERKFPIEQFSGV